MDSRIGPGALSVGLAAALALSAGHFHQGGVATVTAEAPYHAFNQVADNMDSTNFSTKELSTNRDAVAPDGSDVRLLLTLRSGGLAHFQLAAGKTSKAVAHRTVEEIWFFLGGRGEMWRRQGERVETVQVKSGTSLTIPLGTHFQFRSLGPEPLTAVGVTMPPWPGDGEAFDVHGPWEPNVRE